MNDKLESHYYKLDEIKNICIKSGVYKFFNKGDNVIYVGKAKNLKKRVSSYFCNRDQHGVKTLRLVAEIVKVEITVVKDEFEALLLENNLIKNHQPKYNILLKDDKSYPYIVISQDRFPKIYTTYKNDNEKGRLYGPFAKVKYANDVIDLIKLLYPFRTCNYNLSDKNIKTKKFRACLEYHLGNCKAPCVGLQNEKEYTTSIEAAINILKGNFSEVKKNLKERMHSFAEKMNFEEAEEYKKKIDLLENYQAKSIIINPETGDFNVFGVEQSEQAIFVHYMEVICGAISFSKTFIAEKKIDEKEESVSEILEKVIFEIITTHNPRSFDNVSNVEVKSFDKKYSAIVPQIGDKKKIVLLAMKNAMNAKQDFSEKVNRNSEKVNSATIDLLQKDLNLPSPPSHIVCFDNSNLMGTNPVASMVCFKNGKPAKKFYRHFNVKTVHGPNDFASMEEVVSRAFKDKKDTLPNLIIIDGGKGQLSSAVKALKMLGLYEKIPIVSIAKRLEEIYKPNESLPICINKKSPSLKLVQRLRDEAHRFAIEFHRMKRSKESLKNPMEEIPGIGPKTAQLLIEKFQCMENILQADKENLINLLGKKKAMYLLEFLKTYDNKKVKFEF